MVTDEELVALFPGAGVSHDSATHYRGRLQEQLLINSCRDCGHWHQPPRPLCPSCQSWNVEAKEIAGTGTVHLVTRLRQGPPAEGVDYTNGYLVVTVELDEQPGLRFTSTLLNAPEEELLIGRRVHLDWRRRGPAPLPVFVLDER
ncbi:MAG: hypothetical protein QOC92_3715 [Acidimicrobiaceae bacterium]|jgi:uncharacterized OB-fold protein